MKSASKSRLVWKEGLKAASKLGVIDSIRDAVGLNRSVPKGNASLCAVLEKSNNPGTFNSCRSYELPLLRRTQMLQ